MTPEQEQWAHNLYYLTSKEDKTDWNIIINNYAFHTYLVVFIPKSTKYCILTQPKGHSKKWKLGILFLKIWNKKPLPLHTSSVLCSGAFSSGNTSNEVNFFLCFDCPGVLFCYCIHLGSGSGCLEQAYLGFNLCLLWVTCFCVILIYFWNWNLFFLVG